MNILWIYNQPLNPEAGGTERMTSLLAKGLCMRGHQCLGILVFEEDSKDIVYESEKITDLYVFLCKKQIDIVINQIAYSEWLLRSFLERGGQEWHQKGGKIISCLHFDPKNPSLYFLLNSKKDKSMVDRLHVMKALLLHKYYERKQQQNEGAIYNYIYEHSDWLVALSETHFPYLRKVMKQNDYSRLTAINNPLTFDDISTPDILQEKEKIVLVCSRMSEYHKRISLVLKAWKTIQRVCKDWQLVILGDGPDLQSYKDYVTHNHLSNVRFEGQQSPESYYRKASILLLTSSAEGWGLTLTEGLQRGVVPVVMNSSVVFSEIIQNNYNGFLTPNNDVKAFCNKIVMLMSNPSLLKDMTLHALDSAKKFSLEDTMGKWGKIL